MCFVAVGNCLCWNAVVHRRVPSRWRGDQNTGGHHTTLFVTVYHRRVPSRWRDTKTLAGTARHCTVCRRLLIPPARSVRPRCQMMASIITRVMIDSWSEMLRCLPLQILLCVCPQQLDKSNFIVFKKIVWVRNRFIKRVSLPFCGEKIWKFAVFNGVHNFSQQLVWLLHYGQYWSRACLTCDSTGRSAIFGWLLTLLEDFHNFSKQLVWLFDSTGRFPQF